MTTAWDIVYYILLPLAWILELVFLVIRITATPLLFLLGAIFHALSLPLRILAKFEALGYYFGVAALFGVGVGVSAHFVSRFVVHSLQLDHTDQEVIHARRRTRRDYPLQDKEKEKLTLKTSPSPNIPLPAGGFTGMSSHDRMTPKSPSAMMSTAILEEVDSTEGSES